MSGVGETGYAELAVTITAEGAVTITRDYGDEFLAAHATNRIAAALDQPGIRVTPPGPGVALLACRCGRALDAADMRRTPGRRLDSIDRIVCKECS